MNTLNQLFRLLARLGCRYVFGVPGREAIAFEGLWSSGVEYIVCRHEQAAGFMAAGYGRASGRPGVCQTTFGPGVTNLVTSVADAYLDRVPLLAICAQVEADRCRWGTHQYVDTCALLSPVSKAFREVKRPEGLESTLEAAYRLAGAEPPGPVVLSIPLDVLAQEWQEVSPRLESLPTEAISLENPSNSNELAEASAMFNSASRAVVLCGAETARDQGAREPLNRLIQARRAPCVTTYAAKGVVSERSDWSLGPIGRYARPAAKAALEAADLLVVAGYDESEGGLDLALRWSPETTKLLILGGNVQTPHGKSALRVAGSAAKSFAVLIESSSEWRESQPLPLPSRAPWEPDGSDFSSFIAKLQACGNNRRTLVCDVGMHKHLLALHYVAERPQEIHFSSGLGCAGLAIPTAIGVALALQGQPVDVVTGDGGFLMNVHDLETLARLGLPITILLFEDGAFGLIEAFERSSWGGVFGARFGNPDFCVLARSFGIESHYCQSLAEAGILAAMQAPASGPRIVVIPIDYSQENLSHVAH